MGGIPQTRQSEHTVKQIRSFIDALNGSPMTSWTDRSKTVVFEDPVGTTPQNMHKVIESYELGLPPFTATLRHIRVGQDEFQAAAVVEFIFAEGSELAPLP